MRREALKAELERMVPHCAGGRIADCRVIEVLGNHAYCSADHGRESTEVSERSEAAALSAFVAPIRRDHSFDVLGVLGTAIVITGRTDFSNLLAF